MKLEVPEENVVFFYMVRGKAEVNGETAERLELINFDIEGSEIQVKGAEDSYIIFGYAEALKEPIAAQGPFVMNTQKEIIEAYSDYRAGKFKF